MCCGDLARCKLGDKTRSYKKIKVFQQYASVPDYNFRSTEDLDFSEPFGKKSISTGNLDTHM